ncbi:MAG: 50S ribosomal protein L25 [Myxococcota bacterium]|nr:50S ribosomal protein L25 [Myxococcota bacterium]
MERPVVNAEVRTETGKGANRRLRAAGRFPAVVYGTGTEPVSITLEPSKMADLLNGAYGRNTVMDLQIEGEDSPRLVIVKDLQLHAIRRTLDHMDLWQIAEDKPLNLRVHFRRIGMSAAEKLGAVVHQSRAVVHIRCLPADIPPGIEFDMTTLTGEFPSVNISEVPMPDGVEATYKQDYSMLRLSAARAMVAAEETEAEGAEGGDAQASDDGGTEEA